MIIRADARALPLRDGGVDCIVTSPPYWGLRDYGNADQLGLEPTPEAYVAGIVAVFRELARVVKPTGTVWLNLADSYFATSCTGTSFVNKPTGAYQPERYGAIQQGRNERNKALMLAGYKPKNLVGIPWRVALALQADGWYLRADIIWAKPNPMPESVTDRPTKAHEYLFLLSKSARYYYDADAIREDAEYGFSIGKLFHRVGSATHDPIRGGGAVVPGIGGTRNKRSVWTINTQPYEGAHFATFPEALVEPCILAGCPLGGLVLDPFLGSGTVGAVAERLSRRWVGTDLAYHDLATERTAQRGFRFEFAEAVS